MSYFLVDILVIFEKSLHFRLNNEGTGNEGYFFTQIVFLHEMLQLQETVKWKGNVVSYCQEINTKSTTFKKAIKRKT